MTREEFDLAALSLGVTFTPGIEDQREVQWKIVEDPQQNDRASVSRIEGMLLADLADGKQHLVETEQQTAVADVVTGENAVFFGAVA